MLQDALQFVQDLAAQGKNVMFIGTKRQAQEAIAEEAKRCGMPLRHRALARRPAHELRDRPPQPRAAAELEMMLTGRRRRSASGSRRRSSPTSTRSASKLEKNLDRHQGHEERARRRVRDRHAARGDRGRRGAQAQDPGDRHLDTNSDPDEVDVAIPGNDDALRAIRLFASKIADAVLAGRGLREAQLAETVAGGAEPRARRRAAHRPAPAATA